MKCPNCNCEINPAQMLGSLTSEKKKKTSSENLKKGLKKRWDDYRAKKLQQEQ